MIEVAQALGGEPWCLTPDEVRRSTFTWFYRVAHAARDQEGRLERTPRDAGSRGPESFRSAFFRFWRRRKLAEWDIERLYAIQMKKEAEETAGA